jgi:antiphage defense system Thoeris ThsA-like protein
MTKRLLKRVSLRYLVVLGTIWLVLEPAGLFIPKLQAVGWLGYISLLGLAFLITAVFFRPPSSAEVTLPESQTLLRVQQSDLLDQAGNIVVGTNDTFDTEIGGTISLRSVQGQFQQRVYGGDEARLDADIAVALTEVDGVAVSDKPYGKQLRYPIGQTIALEKGESRYFLVAYCGLSETKSAETDLQSLWTALEALWESVNARGQYSDVHIPVIGSKFARTGLSHSYLIQMIVMSFVLAVRVRKPAPSLTIHVHPDDSLLVDFDQVQTCLNSLSGVGQAP